MTPMFGAFIATIKIRCIGRPSLRGKRYDHVRLWFGAYSICDSFEIFKRIGQKGNQTK